MKKLLLIGLVVIMTAALAAGAYAAKGFPKRNITDVVVWGAGGGTDTCNRIIMAEMANFLGVNINVININEMVYLASQATGDAGA